MVSCSAFSSSEPLFGRSLKPYTWLDAALRLDAVHLVRSRTALFVAVPTTVGGDGHSYPQLQSKVGWKQMMGPGVNWLCEFLERVPGGPIWPEFKICERSRGFQEHVPGDKHLRILVGDYLVTSAVVEDVREKL